MGYEIRLGAGLQGQLSADHVCQSKTASVILTRKDNPLLSIHTVMQRTLVSRVTDQRFR